MSDVSDTATACKVLVTAGTTGFDALIEAVDRLGRKDVVFQIGPGTYIPQSGQHFRFRHNLQAEAKDYELIVSHAGAGTVYAALESGWNLIVVPNLQRHDKHQRELAAYLEQNHLSRVCWDLAALGACIDDALQDHSDTLHYVKEPFRLPDHLLHWLRTGRR